MGRVFFVEAHFGRRFSFLSFSFFLILAFFSTARGDPTVVKGNHVYRLWVEFQAPEGKWSSDPRQQAIVEAHRRALKVMVSHLYGDEAFAILSSPPPDEVLLDMVQSFSVKKEKVKPHQYQGIYHFTFKKHALKKWLKNQKATVFAQGVKDKGEEEEEASLAEPKIAGVAPPGTKIILQVSIQRFLDWLQIEQALASASQHLHHKHVLMLSQRGAEIALSWKGSPDLFIEQLQRLGFKVTKSSNRWFVERQAFQASMRGSFEGLMTVHEPS